MEGQQTCELRTLRVGEGEGGIQCIRKGIDFRQKERCTFKL